MELQDPMTQEMLDNLRKWARELYREMLLRVTADD